MKASPKPIAKSKSPKQKTATSERHSGSNLAVARDLGAPTRVLFAELFLDPNNPRIAPDPRPGYDDPQAISNPAVQAQLADAVKNDKDLDSLVQSIIDQGWASIDSVLVWEHPEDSSVKIVVEGNRRTVALREIRVKYPVEQKKLEKMHLNVSRYTKKELLEQETLVRSLGSVIKDTEHIYVLHVMANNPEELEAKLPRILGVRHVTHAQQWNPFALSKYLLDQYESRFRRKFGAGSDIAIDPLLVSEVGLLVSLNQTEAKKLIRSASAFRHLTRDFQDRLSTGDTFAPSDHYYLQQLIDSKNASEQFEFTGDKLFLDPEKEEVLFQWCFKCPRGSDANILRKAEDFRVWQKIKKYDGQHMTGFASELDVSKPESATPMDKIEAKYLAHKAHVSPLDTLSALLEQVTKISADMLLTQASHLRPILEELSTRAKAYVDMMKTQERP